LCGKWGPSEGSQVQIDSWGQSVSLSPALSLLVLIVMMRGAGVSSIVTKLPPTEPELIRTVPLRSPHYKAPTTENPSFSSSVAFFVRLNLVCNYHVVSKQQGTSRASRTRAGNPFQFLSYSLAFSPLLLPLVSSVGMILFPNVAFFFFSKLHLPSLESGKRLTDENASKM